MENKDVSQIGAVDNMKLKLLRVIFVIFIVGCGTTGPQGVQGISGPTGASDFYIVQFCPGITPLYPSTFPEQGICIDGQLYAILDQSNGYDYLTIIPSGQYTSEATNASCSFTVSDNCVVTDD